MITIDFETKSHADLPKVGSWAYSEDPTTDIICVAYGIDRAPIQTWWPGKDYKGSRDTMPFDLLQAILSGHEVEAHNVAFERSIWSNVLKPKYGWVMPEDQQWRDTMAVARYYALPGGLANLARVLGFENKDAAGGRLISKYSKLFLKTSKEQIPEEDFKTFVEYCIQDVKIEQSVSDFLGDLPDKELPIFQLDQRINMRGLYLDISGISKASTVVEQRAAELTKEFIELTGCAPSQTAVAKEWFASQGLELDNMQAAYLKEILEGDEVPQGPCRRALEIRTAISKASTKKLDAMVRQIGKDGTAKFQTVYHGTATGRWTGSGFQPLNLSRGFEGVEPEQLVRDIGYGDAAYLDMTYGDAMDAIGKASRHWVMARPGHNLIAGDFTSIEAVILVCLAGEQWKIDAFREGVKIYETMADKIYNLPAGTVSKDTHPAERQDGKTGELAFGYQGALGAWLKFDNSGRHSDERIIEICKAWRAEHPMIVKFWADMQRAAIDATRGIHSEAGVIKFEMVDNWLTMVLPNQKRVWYYDPQVRLVRPRWCVPEEDEKCRDGTCKHARIPALSYMSQKEGQWKRVWTYGGKLTENVCQAVSREILVPAILRAEEAGYPTILSVYDEIVAEIPEGFGNVEEFRHLMNGPLPDWANGWPIKVDTPWIGKRYRK